MNTYSNNWTPPRRRRMRSPPNNILSRKQPMPPSETAYMVQRLQVQDCSFIVLNGKVANVKFFGCAGYI